MRKGYDKEDFKIDSTKILIRKDKGGIEFDVCGMTEECLVLLGVAAAETMLSSNVKFTPDILAALLGGFAGRIKDENVECKDVIVDLLKILRAYYKGVDE